MNLELYFFIGLGLYLFAYLYYLIVSKGLGNKAIFLQMRRFVPCAVLAVLPCGIANISLLSSLFVIPMLIAFCWVLAYPTSYYLSNNKVELEINHHFEAPFGLYFVAWMTSLCVILGEIKFLAIPLSILVSFTELVFLLIPVSIIIYHCLYNACIDANGMQLIQETHYNEIIEFAKSLSIYAILSFLFVVISLVSFIFYNIEAFLFMSSNSYIVLGINSLVFIFTSVYLWKKEHGVFVRTGIVELYLDIKEYRANNLVYAKNVKERISKLKGICAYGEKFNKPSTILLVIGESASRDYMQVFNNEYKYPTTPWLKSLKENNNFIFFPNAYSCGATTVFTCSRAFTEMNQYNNKAFYESCSIVDVAQKLGYKVHWYSNQGHLGCADTPITLVANTANVAKWTKQELNTVQYDESLMHYLDEIDPNKNNFLVLHLKGSHVVFMNRYPKEFTRFGTPGRFEVEENYANSIAYTDMVLQKFFEYAKEKLNLQAMIYFSDHGTIPTKRRSPKFAGVDEVRIPLFTYFSDEYVAKHRDVYEALNEHKDYYWTNDLAYELICNIFDVDDKYYDKDSSLASYTYKYKKDDLKVYDKNVDLV